MFQQLLTIARNTFIESIRQPIITVLTLVGFLAMVFNVALAAYSMETGSDTKLMVDMGLSTLFVLGLFMAAFTATGVLSQEIENKTALTVVSKPVGRPIFVLGKFLGVTGAVGMAYLAVAATFLMAARHQVMETAAQSFDGPVLTFGLLALFGSLALAAFANYYYHKVFTSTFMISVTISEVFAWLLTLVIGKGWTFVPIGYGQNPYLIVGLCLVFLGLLIIVAAAIAASTRLGQVMTLVICSGMFLLGVTSDYVQQQFAEVAPVLGQIYKIVPDLQFFVPMDAISQDFGISARYFLFAALQAGFFIAAILLLAIGLFQTREVG